MSAAEPNPPASFVKAHLLQGALYSEDSALWEILLQQRADVAHFLRQIGQELVLDEAEGYAFLRQIEPTDQERVPRLALAHARTAVGPIAERAHREWL